MADDNLRRGLRRRQPGEALPGWRDTMASPADAAPETERQLQKKTYTVYGDQHERLIALAEASGANLNDYFRTVLDFLLEDLEAGTIQVEFKAVVRRADK